MTTTPPSVVRLHINLASDTADVLKELARKRNTNVTETVRRAISVLHFLETEVLDQGHTLALIETKGSRERVRELKLLLP